MEIDDLYPNPFEINGLLQKARLFVGDRWVVVGDLVTTYDKYGCFIQIPDVEEFLDRQEVLDDGTLDWAAWGARVN